MHLKQTKQLELCYDERGIPYHYSCSNLTTNLTSLTHWCKMYTMFQNVYGDPKYTRWFKNVHSDPKYTQWSKIYSVIQNIHGDSKYTQWSNIYRVIQNMHGDLKCTQWSKMYTVIQNVHTDPKYTHANTLGISAFCKVYYRQRVWVHTLC